MALTMPLVDETDRLRGLLIGTGGSSPRVLWYPLTSPGPRWSPVLDRLRSVDTAGTAAREGTLAPGRVRTVPIRGGIGFVQPKYRWRPQTVPTLSRVALLSGDTALSILPNATMPSRGEVPVAAGDMKATVSALYSAMRAALQRGDWVAFGRAFDALGKTVGRGPGTENPP